MKIDIDWFVLKWWTTAPKLRSALVWKFLSSQSRKCTYHKKGGTIIKLYVYQVLFVKVQFIKITHMYIVLNKNWYMILVNSLLQFVSLYPYFHLRYSSVWLFPRKTVTAWKLSKCRVISGPYFPVFSANKGKHRPEITTYLDTFHAVNHLDHMIGLIWYLFCSPTGGAFRIHSNIQWPKVVNCLKLLKVFLEKSQML